MSTTKVTADMIASGAIPSIATLEYNQAILAFKVASANQLAKFSMVDQVIDEYQDATGIDAGASTNELAGGATTAKYYGGGVPVTPTTSSVGSVASTGTVDGDYTYYKWTTVGSSHSFTTDTAQDYEYLVVAGGGAAGDWGGAGGGGGYRAATGFPVAPGTISGITVGAGGLAQGNGTGGLSGGNSVFSTITSSGGGGGANDGADHANAGGSGGGGTYYTAGTVRAGAAGNSGGFTPVEGYAGGSGASGNYGGGGGGGAASVGGDGVGNDGGNGGAGINNDITGSVVGYSGGGGGATNGGTPGTATHGGGSGATSTHDGTGADNTGGGGGADSGDGTNHGGSGIVVIRRLTTIEIGGGDLTLQSVATTAKSAPTTANLVVLIEDSGSGTADLASDIKAKVSRDGSAFTGYVTFTDEGNWGTDKRILRSNDIDLTGVTSGTSMKYKIETFNQSAGVKETRIHATSLAWA